MQYELLSNKSVIDNQLTDILTIPRIEEQYLRVARNIVKQKTIAMNEKELKYKSLKDEIKLLNYWKTKNDQNEFKYKQLEKEFYEYKKYHYISMNGNKQNQSNRSDWLGVKSNNYIKQISKSKRKLDKAISLSNNLETISDPNEVSNTIILLKKNTQLKQRIHILSSKLAFARACPMYNTTSDTYNSDSNAAIKSSSNNIDNNVDNYIDTNVDSIRLWNNDHELYDLLLGNRQLSDTMKTINENKLTLVDEEYYDNLNDEEIREIRSNQLKQLYEYKIWNNKTTGPEYIQNIRQTQSFHFYEKEK